VSAAPRLIGALVWQRTRRAGMSPGPAGKNARATAVLNLEPWKYIFRPSSKASFPESRRSGAEIPNRSYSRPWSASPARSPATTNGSLAKRHRRRRPGRIHRTRRRSNADRHPVPCVTAKLVRLRGLETVREGVDKRRHMLGTDRHPVWFGGQPSVDAGRLLLSSHRVLGQDASQIQRQHLLEFSHNQGFPFWICFTIERHHASDYLERYVCGK
jgi:hypothetical protein